jgi:activating signal cointegrator complex subunit 3
MNLQKLESAMCVRIDDDDPLLLHAAPLGRIASHYYLSYISMQLFAERLRHDTDYVQALQILVDMHEYAEVPVRHNEDLLNAYVHIHATPCINAPFAAT